ncbi:OmpH family outer membrane protein [Rickettsiaceae bacterium]|nr:OmpH family outer membrane protein [Rickettsiaceae bacterium]
MRLISKILSAIAISLLVSTPLVFAEGSPITPLSLSNTEEITSKPTEDSPKLLQPTEIDPNKFQAYIAVVDVESILENSQAITHIKKSIAEINKQIQKEFSEKELSLKSIETDLIQQRGVLSKEEYDAKVSEFNKQVSSAQQEMQKKKSALEQAHTTAISEVHNNTLAVISELSKKHNFNVVLPSAQVFFVENNLNITLEVITALNKRLKTVEVNYNPDSKK